MLETIGTPTLWTVTMIAIVVLLAFDFFATRKPHEVSMREAVGWSIFYVALPLAFGVWVVAAHGSTIGVDSQRGLDCLFGCFDDECVECLSRRYARVQRFGDLDRLKFTVGYAVTDGGNTES